MLKTAAEDCLAEDILLFHCVTPEWEQTRASRLFWVLSRDPSPLLPPSSPLLTFLTVQLAPAASYLLDGQQAQQLPLASLSQQLVLPLAKQMQELD